MNVIDNLLRYHEDRCLLGEALCRATDRPHDLVGALRNWRGLRRSIMRGTFNAADHQLTDEYRTSLFASSSALSSIPELIAGWCQSSRRVYRPTEDLQRLLELTSVNNVLGTDINLPFPNFVIELPVPIVWKQRGGDERANIDTLFVNKIDGGIALVAFASDEWSDPSNRIEMTRNVRERLESCLEQKRYGKLEKVIGEYAIGKLGNPTAQLLGLPLGQTNVMEDVEETTFKTNYAGSQMKGSEMSTLCEEWKLVVRLVVGLLLRIDLIRRGKGKISVEERESWRRLLPHTPDPRAVTNQSEICELQTSFRLSEQEVEIHRKIREQGIEVATRELRASFRPSHWRRPPGKGHDPEADFSVHVRWTIVNRERLPEGALPSGASVTVQ